MQYLQLHTHTHAHTAPIHTQHARTQACTHTHHVHTHAFAYTTCIPVMISTNFKCLLKYACQWTNLKNVGIFYDKCFAVLWYYNIHKIKKQYCKHNWYIAYMWCWRCSYIVWCIAVHNISMLISKLQIKYWCINNNYIIATS